jgi:multidrug efflux pump subunit AcrB
VAQLLAASSDNVPAGAVETSDGEILLRMQERKQWADEFGNIEVIPSDIGANVTLADIATITDGFAETGFHGKFNRQPTVDLQIYRIGDQSPLDIAEKATGVLETAVSSFPPRETYRIDSNTADDYRQRLSLLTENGVLAVIIVLFILALFLDLRLAFWVMMGMSISFIGAILTNIIAFIPPPLHPRYDGQILVAVARGRHCRTCGFTAGGALHSPRPPGAQLRHGTLHPDEAH